MCVGVGAVIAMKLCNEWPSPFDTTLFYDLRQVCGFHLDTEVSFTN